MTSRPSLRDVPVLVTGADGFIGSHLVERLVAEGARVRAFCLYNSRGSAGWLDELRPATRAALDIRLGDIRDARFVERATEGIEVVFHLAALIAIPYSYVAPASRSSTRTSAARSTCSRRPVGRASGASSRPRRARSTARPRSCRSPRRHPAPGAVAVCRLEGRRRPARPRRTTAASDCRSSSSGRSTPTARASRSGRSCRRCSASSCAGRRRSASGGSIRGAT